MAGQNYIMGNEIYFANYQPKLDLKGKLLCFFIQQIIHVHKVLDRKIESFGEKMCPKCSKFRMHFGLGALNVQ